MRRNKCVVKANEAPEKIYVHELSANELDTKFDEYHIEYIRADAFIEKAVAWFKNNTDITPTGIKNFRKAMKGE